MAGRLLACMPSNPPSNLQIQLEEISSSSRPLHTQRKFTIAEVAYCSHYGLRQFGLVQHRFGFRNYSNCKIALHWYEPLNPKRAVVVCHGYFDHSGTWKHAIPALLEAGNTVIIYDHPGHGLSHGERASIQDFGDYVDVLAQVLADCQSRSELPIVLAGHSMGCAVITDYLLLRNPGFKTPRTVFLAPLVQPSKWQSVRVAEKLLTWAVSSVPRILTKNSSNSDYLNFVKADPLHHRRIPLAWTSALLDWNQRAEDFAPSTGRPLTILQGARDDTVDWKYNLDYLRRKFPDATVRMFREGRHQLLNESTPLRSEVIVELVAAVKGSRGTDTILP